MRLKLALHVLIAFIDADTQGKSAEANVLTVISVYTSNRPY